MSAIPSCITCYSGSNPTPLGTAPFALACSGARNLTRNEIEVGLAAGARIYVPPCIAGHVGADTAAVILSEAPHKSEDIVLVVDVGTNAEIVLGNKDRLLAASSPTGPAFEGAQISSGQRAAPGAIERVRIDPATLEPRIKVIGCDLWSDEEGFAEATGKGGATGTCGSGIIEALAEMYLAGVAFQRRRYLRDNAKPFPEADGRGAHLLLPPLGRLAANLHNAKRCACRPIGQGGTLRGRAVC